MQEKILVGAQEAFAKFGYAKCTMIEIAKHARVSRASLYKQFSSKEEVYRALNRKHQQTSMDLTDAILSDESLTFEDKIHQVLDSRIGFFSRLVHASPHATELSQIGRLITGDIVVEYSQPYLRKITVLLKQADSEGIINLHLVQLSARDAAGILGFAASGQQDAIGPNLTVEEFEQRMHKIVDIFLAAVRPRNDK